MKSAQAAAGLNQGALGVQMSASSTTSVGPYAGRKLNREELEEAYKRGERDFRGVDLSSWMRGVNLAWANLAGARITRAPGADFTGANLSGATLDGLFRSTNFQGADLRGAALIGDFRDTKFQGADLSNTDFSRANFNNAHFHMAMGGPSETRKRERKISDQKLADALRKHDGHQAQAAEEVGLNPGAVSARVSESEDDSPLVPFKNLKGKAGRGKNFKAFQALKGKNGANTPEDENNLTLAALHWKQSPGQPRLTAAGLTGHISDIHAPAKTLDFVPKSLADELKRIEQDPYLRRQDDETLVDYYMRLRSLGFQIRFF